MFQPRSIQSSMTFRDKILSMDYILLLSILLFGQLSVFTLFENKENRFEECSEIEIVNSIVKNSNEIYFDFYNK